MPSLTPKVKHSSTSGDPADFICTDNMGKQATAGLSRASSPQRGGSGSRLSAEQKAKWRAAAQRVTHRLRTVRYTTDHSTFSALNVDGLPAISPSAWSARGACSTAVWATPSFAAGDEGRPLCTSVKSAVVLCSQELCAELGAQAKADRDVGAQAVALQHLEDAKLVEWVHVQPSKGEPPAHDDWEAEVGSEASTKESAEFEGQGALDEVRQQSLSVQKLSTGHSSGGSVCGDELRSPVGEEEEQPQQQATGQSPMAKDTCPAAQVQSDGPTAPEREMEVIQELGGFFKSQKGRLAKLRKARGPAARTTGAPEAAPVPAADAALPEAATAAEVPVESAVVEPVERSEASCLSVGLAAEDVRSFLLAFRRAAGPAPAGLEGLSAEPVAAEGPPVLRLQAQVCPMRPLNGRSVPSSSSQRPASRTEALLVSSEKAYRRATTGSLSHMEELRRATQSLLNKVCPESVATIAAKITEIQVQSADELQHLISQIFLKALSEPHYCATHADLIFSIKSAFPEFTSPEGRTLNFKALLLDVCQQEFEALHTMLVPSSEEQTLYDAEELELRQKKRKDRVIANMKFIGHLFLRQMLSGKVISSVIQELTLCHNAGALPEPHCIECAIELLLSIGHTLEAMPVGKQAIGQVCGRLMELKGQKGSDGRGVYCKRIQFAIQDLLDTRAVGWVRKVFGGVARTKEEIRLEQVRDLFNQANGQEVRGSQVIISGQRPQCIVAAQGSV